MDDASRQQKRRVLREQVKLGAKLMSAGFAVRPKRQEIIAVAQVLRSKLIERENPTRASEAAELAHGVMERALRAAPARVAIACRKGCAYCCHSYVMVLPPEVFRLARAVRARSSSAIDASEVTRRGAPLRGLGPAERIGAKLACPLLENGACCVYEERPLVCRQATSLSLPACIEEFEGIDKGGSIEISSAHMTHSSNAHVVLLGAMRGAGLPTFAYELSAALAVALAIPDSEQRWLDGEDIFNDIPRAPARPAQVEQVAAQIAAELAA